MAGHTVILAGASQRQFAHKLIDAAPDGYVVKVSEPTRTTEQNNRFWAMLTDLSIARPEGRTATPETWKLLVMNAFGYECQFEMGLDGKPFAVGHRSSKLSVREMSDLMEWMAAYGAEHGVVFSEPERETI